MHMLFCGGICYWKQKLQSLVQLTMPPVLGKATKCLSSMDDIRFRTVVPHAPCNSGGFRCIDSTRPMLKQRKYISKFTAVTSVMMLASLRTVHPNEWTNPVNDQNQFPKLIHIIHFSLETHNFSSIFLISLLQCVFPFLNRHFPFAISSVNPYHKSRFPNSLSGWGGGGSTAIIFQPELPL